MSKKSPDSSNAMTALLFANLAHFYSHMMMLVYPTVVIALEVAFDLPFGELLSLSLIGFVLYGVAALPAGWLGDKWSSPGMLAIFFFGTGAAGITAGFVSGPIGIAVALAAIGFFSSIYHPVGTAWIVANAKSRGKALGINGVFGTAGIAATPLLAGALTALLGWRFAFIVPGSIILLTGIAFMFFMRKMSSREKLKYEISDNDVTRAQAFRGLSILGFTVLCVGLLAQATTIGMPKIFAVRAPDVVQSAGLIGAGGLASIALAIGAVGQLAGGWLADRYRLTIIYPLIYVVMVPVALLAGSLSNLPLVGAAGAVMFLITASLPTENSLVARYCPVEWRSSAYGAKFVLGLGVSSLAIPLIGSIYDATGGFWWVFAGMAMLAIVIICFAMLLPESKRTA
ncbi:MAG: MFS transporter [Pseudomonadota bacterium]|nr:MFS transporter [Pseudomonadota bacterium]